MGQRYNNSFRDGWLQNPMSTHKSTHWYKASGTAIPELQTLDTPSMTCMDADYDTDQNGKDMSSGYLKKDPPYKVETPEQTKRTNSTKTRTMLITFPISIKMASSLTPAQSENACWAL